MALPSCSDLYSYEQCTHPEKVFCCSWCNSTRQCLEEFWTKWCSEIVYTDAMKAACDQYRSQRRADLLKLAHFFFWALIILLGLGFLFWFLTGFAWAFVWGQNQLEARRLAARRRREAAHRAAMRCMQACRLFGPGIDQPLLASEVLQVASAGRSTSSSSEAGGAAGLRG